MFNKKYLLIFWLANVLILGILFLHFYSLNDQSLKVEFFDVGQGDAILICRSGKRILIDGGPSEGKIMEKLGQAVPFWDKKIDVVILTHPDQDHLSGLMAVLKNYKVEAVIQSRVEHVSALARAFDERIADLKTPVVIGEAGTTVRMDDDTEIEIIWPSKNQQFSDKESNAGSLVAQLSFGDQSFIFTGDLPMQEENELIKNNPNLKAKVLKVSHHGSRYGTGLDFLNVVSPETAVISVGKNNVYGHPNAETLERLRAKNILIFRTDEKGDVEYFCPKPTEKCQES